MSNIDISALRHLSVAERLRLAEALWNSVADDVEADPTLLPVTDAHRGDHQGARGGASRQS